MGYRIRGVTVVLGEMDVARARPKKAQPGWTHPPAGGGRQLSGGQLEVASVPVNDVHQARITLGVGGWWMTLGQDKRRDRLTTDYPLNMFLFINAKTNFI